jgi:hypothetical protein
MLDAVGTKDQDTARDLTENHYSRAQILVPKGAKVHKPPEKNPAERLLKAVFGSKKSSGKYMSNQTIPFHLSSSVATERGNSNYELVLSPGLEIPHAAKDCTVYLHNLLFNNCLANVSGLLYKNNQVTLTLSGQTPINIDLGPSALSIPDVERLIGEHLYADQSGMWAALTTAAEALGENVKLASPYELNWNHTIDVTAGIDAIP